MVLASASPRRKKLLGFLGIPFEVDPSGVHENIKPNLGPADIAETLAIRKARDVARLHPEKTVVGADTIVVHEHTVLGKPETPDKARRMLARLSNSSHRVLTGVALSRANASGSILKKRIFHESTDVTFGSLDEKEIERYVAGGSPMDKAGAYGIQDDWGAVFVKRIEGDFYNIVGLPLHALYHRLKDFAPELF